MRIPPPGTQVLDEIARLRDLADVVVVADHPGQERIAARNARRGLAERAHHEGVVVGSRSLHHKPFQDGTIQVGIPKE